MTPDQCRMARAALGWGVRELEMHSGINKDTIARFENDGNVRDSTVAKLQETFESAGLEFTPHNGCGEGVRWAKPPKKRTKAAPPGPAKRKK